MPSGGSRFLFQINSLIRGPNGRQLGTPKEEAQQMAENFVDVVGYQLEKLHIGVLAWLLDSERSPLPLPEQATVMGKLAPELFKGAELTEVKSRREYSFGRRRRIDLV